MQFQQDVAPPGKIAHPYGCQNGAPLKGRRDPKAQGIDRNDPAPGDPAFDQAGQGIGTRPLPTRGDQAHGLTKVSQPHPPKRSGQCK